MPLTMALNKKKSALSTSDKIDRVVTNRWLALPIFADARCTLGNIATTWVSGTLFGDWITNGALGWLQSLIADGIIGD